MIFSVLGQRERTGRIPWQFRSGQTRNKKRDRASVSLKRRPVPRVELVRFAPHHDGIKDREVNDQEQGGNPRLRGDTGTQSQDSAAQIEWIASVSVWTGDGEDFLLMKIARCIRAHPQSNHPCQGAQQDTARCGTGERENGDGERIAETYPPACKKIAGGAHWRLSTCRRTASKTVSTAISRMEGSA
jgi:hypothetical protein